MDTFNMSVIGGSFLGVDELQVLKNHVKILFEKVQSPSFIIFFILKFKSQESEWRSQRTKLEQTIELLELKLRETKEREENLRNLNNSIMTAFNDVSKETTNPVRKLIWQIYFKELF